MSTEDLAHADLAEITRLLRERRVSPVELLEATLERIARLNPLYNAYISVFDEALDAMRRIERRHPPDHRSKPLYGIPISIKDLIVTTDGPTTAGSRIFGEGQRTRRDAPVVRRLRHAGAVIVGKTNLHEIALGVTNENEHFGAARNPWDRTRVSGGSSGGSAVAVALGLGYGSVGTDTRGSIRIPAACCGVTGIKPTRGLVPTEGVIPLSWTLDNVGPLGRSVADAAVLTGIMAGGKRLDRYREALEEPGRPRRIGVPDYLLRDVDPEVEGAVSSAIEVFERLRYDVRSVRMPELEATPKASGTITLGEAYTYHERHLRERANGFGESVRKRLERGRALTAVDFVRAERTRLEVVAAFDRAFRSVDCLVGATMPALPPTIGERTIRVAGKESTPLRELPRLTGLANMGGIPAMSLPCGFSGSGLPIGLQLLARRNREDVLFTTGHHYQRETDWHRRRPHPAG